MKKLILVFLGLLASLASSFIKAQEPADSLYLMAYFKSPAQHLFYAVSKDGLNWKETNGGRPIFTAFDDRIWMRDPFLQRVEKDGVTTFHLVHTWGWDNPAIFHWESDDLINWRASNGKKDTESGKIYVMDGKEGRPSAPNAWAPEFTYVPEEDTFYVYWSSRIDDHQVHYVTSTKDWLTFTTPQVLFDPGITAIDLTVLPYNGKYYGFYKDERNGRKTILRAETTSLNPDIDQFKGITDVLPPDFKTEVEGPSIFAKLDGSGWIAYADEFNGDKGLVFAECDDLGKPWNLIPKEEITNVPDVKHGSVIKVSRKEVEPILKDYSAWQRAGNRIMTEWGKKLSPTNVWQTYPRPIMEREYWENLNGIWKYSILPEDSEKPKEFEGNILVPFAVESALSGVGRTVGQDSVLWYQREFTVPSAWAGKEIMLNFGAVDWKADVWVNNVQVGSHTGGYTPFSFNISKALQKGENTLTIKVWDPTDKGFQPRGKQVGNPESIWYTPVTGIWQTVWLEPVEENYIKTLKILPDIDKNVLSVNVFAHSNLPYLSEVKVFDNGKEITSGNSKNSETIVLDMPENIELWCPANPKLYDLIINIYDEDHNKLDEVKSYAAMRKISTGKDEKGIVRLQLNNEDIFHFGPLDQGWWPDGLYTAPSPKALVYDIDKTKEWGFNMIRKHVKVEPAIWYTYCDRNGILVWQDMPSGDGFPEWQNRSYFNGEEYNRSKESEENYREEWKEIIDYLYNNPSVVVWVPFNEGWGQFKTKEIAEWTKEYDPSRLVNPASGGNFFKTGDIIDLHNYPGPEMYLTDPERVNVLGEYGGIGLVIDGHIWTPDNNWGYVKFKSPEEVTDQYVEFAEELLEFVPKGFSGAVYTQTTDVEMEVNGLMTYDRKVVKIKEDKIRDANKKLTQVFEKSK